MSALRFLVLALLALGAPFIVACGGNDDDSDGATGPTASSAASLQPGSGNAGSAASPTTGSQGSGQARVPDDPCSLLTLDEVHRLAPTTGAGKKVGESGAPGQSVAVCRWEWPEGVGTLDVRIQSIPAGVTVDQLKTSLRAEVRDGGREVQGIGDYAIIRSSIAADAEVKAVANGLLFNVDLNVLGARDKQEELITLARAAAGRLAR